MALSYKFYQRNAVDVARDLVGKLLIRKIAGHKIVTKIVETEAYKGPEDKASHAFNNKRTKRTEVMFKSGGLAYIYLIYGMYYCLNVVTGHKERPEAVLIRAVEPIAGLEIIRKNRNIKSDKIEDLTNGPGKLCQALKIDKNFNGSDLVKDENLYIKKMKLKMMKLIINIKLIPEKELILIMQRNIKINYGDSILELINMFQDNYNSLTIDNIWYII